MECADRRTPVVRGVAQAKATGRCSSVSRESGIAVAVLPCKEVVMFLAILLALAPNDALFPSAGSVAGSVATGIPYLGIGEVAYGVTDRFAVGVVGGVTPTTVGGGVRLRGVLFERGDDRLVIGSPLL